MSDNKHIEDFQKRHPNVQWLDLVLPSVLGVPCGKRIFMADIEKLVSGKVRLPRSIHLFDITGETCYDAFPYGISDGDPDYICHPSLDTLSIVPWSGGKIAQVFCNLADGISNEVSFTDSRATLSAVIDKLAELDITAKVAVELEFQLLDKSSYRGQVRPYRTSHSVLRRGTWFSQNHCASLELLHQHEDILEKIHSYCGQQGLQVESNFTEYAPGQFEINFPPYEDILLACDHGLMFKQLVKRAALEEGCLATFMAKPMIEQPGNGLHIHISLYDKNKQNILTHNYQGDLTKPENMTKFRHIVGGMQHTSKESMLVFAPNVNSVRRFQEGSYAPVNLHWGYNNRQVAFRVPPSDRKNYRIEHRMAGADTNIYLVMAIVLSSLHYGLKQKLPLLSQDNLNLPRNFVSIMESAKTSTIIPSYLGHELWSTLLANRQYEFNRFNRTITPLEFEWYMSNV